MDEVVYQLSSSCTPPPPPQLLCFQNYYHFSLQGQPQSPNTIWRMIPNGTFYQWVAQWSCPQHHIIFTNQCTCTPLAFQGSMYIWVQDFQFPNANDGWANSHRLISAAVCLESQYHPPWPFVGKIPNMYIYKSIFFTK